MLKKIRAALELMRPANIVTAFADILAGFAAAGGAVFLTSSGVAAEPQGLAWLLLATLGLYGGGIVFNDVFDAAQDAKERPERAIPDGRISRAGASVLGTALFLTGIAAAYQVSVSAFLLAVFITLFALMYDFKAKNFVITGPLFMGLCRGGNLLLGGSIYPEMISEIWFLALIPVVYISAITLISRGEVEGGNKTHGYLALAMILIVIVSVPLLPLVFSFNLLMASPFLILFGFLVVPAFAKAANTSKAGDIKKAVKRGVVSLVIFNSVLAAGFSGLFLGIVVLLLFPLSMALSRLFAVT